MRRAALLLCAVLLVALGAAATAPSAGAEVNLEIQIFTVGGPFGPPVPGQRTEFFVRFTNFSANSVTVNSVKVTPSCGEEAVFLGPYGCPAASRDPGVFGNAIAVPSQGDCPTAQFTYDAPDPIDGEFTMTPTAPLVLPAYSTPTFLCTADFDLPILKQPTKDSRPDLSGVQTSYWAQATGTDGTTSAESPVSWGSMTIGVGPPPYSPPSYSAQPRAKRKHCKRKGEHSAAAAKKKCKKAKR